MNFDLYKEVGEPNKKSRINIFESLKSDYFLRKIFENLIKKKTLQLINYNKKIQNRVNININDYKEYSSIKIEIIPVLNKYGNFIQINKEEDKKYFHIFFNNKKKEIKRNYLKENENVTKINIMIEYPVISFERLFFKCICVQSIKFKKFNRNNIINMRKMFSGCSSLKEISLSNFNTDNVTNMGDMFNICSSIEKINLSNFRTNNVTDMSGMFKECKELKQIKHFSVLNTANVVDTAYMFYNCSSLRRLNLSNFNSDKIKNMFGMFCGCKLKNFIKDKYKSFKESAFI